MNRPEWSEFWNLRLSNQKVIIDYIDYLEEEVKTLSNKLDKSEKKKHLTELWVKGELETLN